MDSDPLGFATFDIDSIKDENNRHEITISYTFPVGDGELTTVIMLFQVNKNITVSACLAMISIIILCIFCFVA